MADALKQMYFGQPGTSNGTLYTAPTTSAGAPAAVIRNIHICNTTASAASISLGINGSGATAANNIYRTFSIPANGVHIANVNIVLNSGDTIQGLQGTPTALTAIISGVTI